MINKWYDDIATNENTFISSRVRLARNIKGFPFPEKMTIEQKEELIKIVRKAAIDLAEEFDYFYIDDLDIFEKRKLVEKHVITRKLTEEAFKNTAVLVKKDEEVSIMINEDDHIRIQVICSGKNIRKAYEIGKDIDLKLEKHLEYSYSDKYGYLTASPKNIGTGMKVSCMMHLPIIEMIGQLKEISVAVSNVGMELRGMYGDTNDTYGSMYYVRNKVTIGQTEEEILNNVEKIADKIVEQETIMRKEILNENPLDFEDKIYRSYAVLKYARVLNPMEAMILLSDIKLGFETNMLKEEVPKEPIYKIMIMMQPSRIQFKAGRKLSLKERDIERAKYIRELFK